MKVYDCFTFYNEFELLELRLKSLWDVVDCFVLVEADKTQSNIPKPFYFNERKAEFAEFLPKIRHLMGKMDLPYKGVGDWVIEHAQRNLIAQGLQDAAPDDLIFISDLDEIWAPDILQRINNRQVPVIASYTPPQPYNKFIIPCQLMVHAIDLLEYSPIAMAQAFHYYYFDWIAPNTWQGTVLTKRKNLTTPQDLRMLRLHAVTPRIPNGGHHFSYMGGADRIIDKMISIVDGNEMVEKSSGALTDKKHVEESMAKGSDIYGRKGIPESQFYPYDISQIKLPYIQEFVRKYPQFLRPKD